MWSAYHIQMYQKYFIKLALSYLEIYEGDFNAFSE